MQAESLPAIEAEGRTQPAEILDSRIEKNARSSYLLIFLS